MKKRLLALTCAAIMVLSVAGCNSSSNNSSSSGTSSDISSADSDVSSDVSSDLDSESSETPSSEVEDSTSETAGTSEDSALIQEFVDTYKDAMLEAYGSSYEGVMDIDMYEKDGKLVYSFTDLVNDYSSLDAATIEETFDTAMQAQASVFVQAAQQLETLGVSKGVVVIEYYDLNGEHLYSGEFTSDDEVAGTDDAELSEAAE